MKVPNSFLSQLCVSSYPLPIFSCHCSRWLLKSLVRFLHLVLNVQASSAVEKVLLLM